MALGRFQVHKLHEGHIALIRKAAEHTKLVVFICTSPHLVTPDDPLDYPTRERMVREAFPTAVVVCCNASTETR